MNSILSSILLFFGEPIVLLLDTLQHFINTSPETKEFLKTLAVGGSIYFRFFYLFFVLRLMLYWFPNLNPFVPPYYIVLVLTNPSLDYVGKRLPKLFGMDFSFLFVTTMITLAIKFCDTVRI